MEKEIIEKDISEMTNEEVLEIPKKFMRIAKKVKKKVERLEKENEELKRGHETNNKINMEKELTDEDLHEILIGMEKEIKEIKEHLNLKED